MMWELNLLICQVHKILSFRKSIDERIEQWFIVEYLSWLELEPFSYLILKAFDFYSNIADHLSTRTFLKRSVDMNVAEGILT